MFAFDEKATGLVSHGNEKSFAKGKESRSDLYSAKTHLLVLIFLTPG